MDDLAEWFSEAEAKLTTTEPNSSNPDELRHKLSQQKVT